MSREKELEMMLNQSGKKDELRQKLLKQLSESGWRDQVKLVVLDLVHDKGAENVCVEDLVQEVAPKASALVPESARQDLVRDLADFLKDEDY